jgi:putative CocE/NonD family hydrolase
VLGTLVARLLKMPPGRADYTVTRAVRVPMRDGVDLLTDIYAPVGESGGTILIRTPYGRTGSVTLLTARQYASHGYHVVNQSCRGTDGSGGEFVPFSREIDDGADTVAWLRSQPWFGGRFALCGASYLGYSAWAVLMDPPPELAAVVIEMAAHDNHGVTHGAGAFALEATLTAMEGFDHLEVGVLRGLPLFLTARRRLRPGLEELPLVRAQETVLAGSRMPYREWLVASRADDPFWHDLRLGAALERVDVPVLLHDGWEDRFVEQMTGAYAVLRRRGVDVALSIGPWTHVEAVTKGAGLLMVETLDWLGEHLARNGTRSRPEPVRIYVTGAEEWRVMADWPPAAEERVLHLRPGAALGDARPDPAAPASTFAYDPANPTPAVGGRVINPAIGGRRDNRQLERRDDVLTFTGPALVESLEVIGTPVVELVHHTDNPYADLFVRLCEVTGQGHSVNLSDGFRRLGPEDANGTVVIRLDAIAHRFGPGTRLRLQISGGAHARFARNLGTPDDPATSTAMAPSRRTISHGAGGFSRLALPVQV